MLVATVRANRRRCGHGTSSRWEAQPAGAGGRTGRCRGPGSSRSSGGNGALGGAGGLLAGPGCLSISSESGKGGSGRAARPPESRGWEHAGDLCTGPVNRALLLREINRTRGAYSPHVGWFCGGPSFRTEPWVRETSRVVRIWLLLCRCGAGPCVFHRAVAKAGPIQKKIGFCYRDIG